MEYAVNAETHTSPARVRLNVHVRRTAAQGLGNQ